ncbi:HlyD family secretion protein [Vibrio sp. CAU 1672]|uniref:HlyD family secretion protein n=1 Tax=Vibrio sp. CAU 1672 TaxID=3032594 RepID=UPI0023DA7CEF|nr:HlyD family secretion protein [Vibrio sp. CAU 1672]MDF2153805.1 HlyD family secretion protein [Vibrio sp. CAU 1672]
MTPDQKFARWIKYSCCGFAIVFAYFLIADLVMPLTPQAMVTRVVTKVAPRVSGPITQLYVANNQLIHKGAPLFEIDPEPYRLAVEQAQLNLERVSQDNQKLDATIAAAQANLKASKVVLEQREREALRLNTLFHRHGISQQHRDDAESAATAAKANWLAAQARVKELEVSRGENVDENVAIRVAKNQLQQALLNLSYTQVLAEQDGVVTNVQLKPGAYAAAGTPLIALVSEQVDVIADFREKSLRHFERDSKALVAFDSRPGEVFEAQITSLDAGVSSGQFDANGQLATPSSSNRWVRDAQRMRLHLAVEQVAEHNLPAGARATVQLLPDAPVALWFAHLQIRLLSSLHYIY